MIYVAIVVLATVIVALVYNYVSLTPFGPCYVRDNGVDYPGLMYIESNPIRGKEVYVIYLGQGGWYDIEGKIEHPRFHNDATEFFFNNVSYYNDNDKIAIFLGVNNIGPQDVMRRLERLGEVAIWRFNDED